MWDRCVDKAEKNFEEVVEVYRTLVQKDPQTYLPDLIGAQIGLGVLRSFRGIEEARESKLMMR
jgi:hypothetical protein